MTIELAKAKQILVSKIGDMLVDGDLQSFLSGVLSALSLKLEDAPSDGKQYSREDGSWSEVVIPTPDVTEAPVDGKQYVRQDAAWEEVSIPAQGVEEAPADGKTYGRKDTGWVEVTGGGGGSSDLTRLDLMTTGEDLMHPSSFPVQLGEEYAFFGYAIEEVAAESFEQTGIYYSYFTPIEPTMTLIYQTIDGVNNRFTRGGYMLLDGGDTLTVLFPWISFAYPFSTKREPVTVYPNTSISIPRANLYTVSVANATSEVTVSVYSDVILKWTPSGPTDTHTFTFASVPDGQVTIGSSGSFTITNAWRAV